MRAVQCPFCFICLDVTRIPVGKFIKCPACSGPIRVPQPDRRGPLLTGMGGLCLGVVAGIVLTLGLIRFGYETPATTPAKPQAAPSMPAAETVPPRSASPQGHFSDWTVEVDKLTRLITKDHPNVQLLESRPWLVALEEGDYDRTRIIELYERSLQSLKAAFLKEFEALDFPEVRRPLAVLILRNRAAFERYWIRHFGGNPLPENVTGVYHVSRRWTVTYHASDMPLDRLLHEGTHQLVHAVSAKSPSRFWLHEGLGNLFETHRRIDRNGYESIECLPAVNKPRLYDVIPAYDDASLQPYIELDRIVDLSLEDFKVWYRRTMTREPQLRDRVADTWYGASWAITYFMLRGGNPGYRETFMAYLRDEAHGQGVRFEEALGRHAGVSLDVFEKDLEAWLRNLR